MLPMIIWLAVADLNVPMALVEALQSWFVVGPWLFFAALLMISSIATYSASSLRLRRRVRFEAIAIVGFIVAAMITAPWLTLAILAIAYLAFIPFSMMSYRRVKRANG